MLRVIQKKKQARSNQMASGVENHSSIQVCCAKSLFCVPHLQWLGFMSGLVLGFFPKIFVKTLEGRSISVFVLPSDTIAQIKEMIATRESIFSCICFFLDFLDPCPYCCCLRGFFSCSCYSTAVDLCWQRAARSKNSHGLRHTPWFALYLSVLNFLF